MKKKKKAKIISSATTATATGGRGYDPHFFQPLLPEFRRGIDIPEAFMTTYLDEELRKRKRRCTRSNATLPVKLIKDNREWDVHLSGRRLEKGWPEFIDSYYSFSDEQKMDVGDIVIFKHKGNLVFEVFVHDATTGLQKSPNKKKKKMMMNIPKEEEDEQFEKHNHHHHHKKRKRKSATAAIFSPVYTITISYRSVKKNVQYLPKRLVIENGIERNCNMILDDENGRKWEVYGRYYKNRSYFYITKGWQDFIIGNHIKNGDSLKFQLIKNGEKPNFLVILIPAAIRIKNEDEDHEVDLITPKEEEFEAGDQKRKLAGARKRVYPYFDTVIKLSSFKKRRQYLPRRFLRENGLEKNFKMIVENERGRKWEADARVYEGISCFYITKDKDGSWDSFKIVNALKMGDCFRFHLIKNAKKPVFLLTRIKKKDVVDDDEEEGEEEKVNVN